MNVWFFLGGLAAIVFTMIDALRTTLAVRGGGPLTGQVAQGLWRGAQRLHRHTGGHRLLRVMGSVIFLTVIALWILMLWGGWTLAFLSAENAVVASATQAPADFWSRVYFTGFTLYTLGIGDYVPQGALWQVLTALASLNGLFLVTLALTYLVPVVSAAAQEHQLAGTIADLGATPEEIIGRAWTGDGFEGLGQHLAPLISSIELHNQRHLIYPVLHYFHSAEARTAISVNIAVLDEALTLIAEGAAPGVRPASLTTQPARDAIAGLLSMLQQQYIEPAEAPPAPPSLDLLEAHGIPTVDAATYRQGIEAHTDRRRLLRAYVEQDGWSWDQVWQHPQRSA